jgi:hypothetical protein
VTPLFRKSAILLLNLSVNSKPYTKRL